MGQAVLTTDELIRELRQTATNASPSLHRLLCAAADKIEELQKNICYVEFINENKGKGW